MLFQLIPFLLLAAAGLSLSAVTGRKFAKTVAPVYFSAILILYVFYICGMLRAGHPAVTVLCLLICAVALLRRPKALKEILFSRDFLLYLLGSVLFLAFTRSKFVHLWDCLRLWGAYPKALHSFGTLQLGADAALYPIMQTYPPGMPLLGYYFTGFAPVFSENTLFFTYSLFGFALLMPFVGAFESKKGKTAAFLTAVFLPWMITNSLNNDYSFYYGSLFIDMPLGLCCGYFLYRSFRQLGKDSFENLCVLLSCGCLVLLKDSGAFLALCGVVGGGLLMLLRKERTRLVWPALNLALLLGIWGSWKYLLGMYAASSNLTLSNPIPSLSALVRIFNQFLSAPVTGYSSFLGSVSFSLPAALLLIFGAKLSLCLCYDRENLKAELTDLAVQTVCYAGFFIGYCLCFVPEIETGAFPSYNRYFCTLITSALMVLTGDCLFRHRELLTELSSRLKNLRQEDSPTGKLTSCVLTAGRWALILAMAFALVMIFMDRHSIQDPVYVQAEEMSEKLTASTQKQEPWTDVYMVMPEPDMSHHRTYFNLIDDGIRIRNFYDTVNITSSGLGCTADGFLAQLIEEGYDYVLISRADELLTAEFASLFPEAKAGDTNLLYKVDEANARLVFVP